MPFRGAIATASAMGPSVSASSSSASFFCTGYSPDLPLVASHSHSPSPSRRSFSSKATLLEILAREEDEEVDTGNTDMTSDLSELRKTIEESWKIVEAGASTDLHKIETASGNKVRVSFHCQDTLESDEAAESSIFDVDDAAVDEDADEEDEAAAPVRFTVTVTKSGKSLNFACFSEYGEVKIEGVSTTAASTVDYVHEHQGTLPKIEYQGPDVSELAEDLQEALVVYLEEECGVDGDVAAFVAMSSDFREELNYVDFLKEAQSIIS